MSADYVDSTVDSLRRNPRQGERLTVVVAASGEAEDLIEDVAALEPEVEIEDTLPYDVLRLVVYETVLDDLCSLANVESVETEGRLRPHESGN